MKILSLIRLKYVLDLEIPAPGSETTVAENRNKIIDTGITQGAIRNLKLWLSVGNGNNVKNLSLSLHPEWTIFRAVQALQLDLASSSLPSSRHDRHKRLFDNTYK